MDERRRVVKPSEAAKIAHVAPKTVSRWANEGKVPLAFRTPGGHARFYEDDIRAAVGLPQKEEE